jgi:hypothetical protein
MAETSPKASPKKAATKAVPAAKPAAVAKPKSVAKPKPADLLVATPIAAAKPIAETKPASAKKPAAAKAAKPTSKSTAKAIVLSDEQRYRMVAEAAYYRAEKNQFKSDPLRDWIDAENDISALLSAK